MTRIGGTESARDLEREWMKISWQLNTNYTYLANNYYMINVPLKKKKRTDKTPFIFLIIKPDENLIKNMHMYLLLATLYSPFFLGLLIPAYRLYIAEYKPTAPD